MRPLALLSAALLLSGCPSEPPAPRTLAAWIACNDEATGGDALRALQSVEVDLYIDEPQFQLYGHYRIHRDSFVRIDVFADSARTQRVFSEGWDGRTAWQWAAEGDPRAVEEEPAAALRHGYELPGHLWTLADVEPGGHAVALAPADTLDGQAAPVLEVTLADGHRVWYVLDPQTCLVARSRSFRAFHPDLDSTAVWVETVAGPYARRHGVARPTRTWSVDRTTGDTLATTTVLSWRPDAVSMDGRLRPPPLRAALETAPGP